MNCYGVIIKYCMYLDVSAIVTKKCKVVYRQAEKSTQQLYSVHEAPMTEYVLQLIKPSLTQKIMCCRLAHSRAVNSLWTVVCSVTHVAHQDCGQGSWQGKVWGSNADICVHTYSSSG